MSDERTDVVNASGEAAPRRSLHEDIVAVTPKPRTDKQIWGIYIILVCVSLIELYSASSRDVAAGNVFAPLLRHGGLLGLGFLIMLALQRLHYKYIFKATYFIIGASVAAAIYTLVAGQNLNQATRAFSLFGISVQPSELIKLSAALLSAHVLSKYQEKGKRGVEKKGVIIVAVVVLFFCGLLITQGFTNTVIMMFISLGMMVVGCVSWRKFFIVLGIYAALGLCYMGYKVVTTSEPQTTTYTAEGSTTSNSGDRTQMRANRISNYLYSDKLSEPIDQNNQQEQYSYIAQANGGVIGVGPGNSRETARLPLASSDFVYAIIIEDTGLIGGICVLVLYLWLLGRSGVIASQCKKAYPAFLVIGMALFIVLQALAHMAIVTGASPVSGQPLPLISRGGSSVIITSVALGIMLSVSRFALRKGDKQAVREVLTSLSDNAMADSKDNPSAL